MKTTLYPKKEALKLKKELEAKEDDEARAAAQAAEKIKKSIETKVRGGWHQVYTDSWGRRFDKRAEYTSISGHRP